MREEKRFKKSRLIYVAIGVLYLFIVIAATVYSQTIYIDRLPVVELAPKGASAGAMVPVEYLRQLPDGSWKVDAVRQMKGPWGNKYVISEIKITTLLPIEGREDYVRAFELMGNSDPLVAKCSAETYEGMEVRLRVADG